MSVPFVGRDPTRWPGYVPRAAVQVWRLPTGPVAVAWDFSVYGGSFGEDDATALVAAADLACAEQVPLLSLVRSGGTRLQEGMAALVGIPRARLALLALAEAGLPHLSVADAPTTGGVWVTVASAADLRVAVVDATVGFAGPRVVEAVTGTRPDACSHTGASAYAAGLVDAALDEDDVPDWVQRALRSLAPAAGTADGRVSGWPQPLPARSGWEQVQASRAPRPGGRDLLEALLGETTWLAAPHGDDTVAAAVGRLDGRPVVGVATAARPGFRPTPDGYRLLARAARLADRLRLPLLSLVDTPGAEPGPQAERDGVAPAMGDALDALLLCRSPTVALVHGEGGSGGALAAAACDRVLVTATGYFAAIAPEGAAAALRRPAQECADLMRVTPADLLALGAADAAATTADLATTVAALAAQDDARRLAGRRTRWSSPLPGRL